MENRFPKICIIGAGFSGLCMAIKLKTQLGIHSFTIFEANPEVGGTWYSNRYPGCSCDITSQLYSLSFEPNYDWSQGCAPQEELLDYLKCITKKHELYPHIRLQTKVESLRWNPEKCKWHATILDTKRNKTEQDDFDIVIGATGKIRYPNYPQEYLQFQGPLIHTAEWDDSISLEGKRVGVIGSQASGVQLISAIATKVETLTIFQRSAPHIIPRWWQWEYSNLTRWTLRTFPFLRLLLRIFWFFTFEFLLYPSTRHGSFINRMMEKQATSYRKSKIKDEELLRKVTPSIPILCKRIVPHESYYDAISLPNVEVITEGIKELNGNVLKTEDGKDFEVDVLILATGFQISEYFAPMQIYGRDGVNVLDLWRKERPQGYLGVAYQEMPNFFYLMGPYTEVGSGSSLFNVECQVEWVISCIREVLKIGARSMTLKKEAEVNFMRMIDRQVEGSVWKVGHCAESWYFDKQGRNVLLWAGSQRDFWRVCRNFDAGMFKFS